jgi:hypothetical protein
MAGYMRKYVPYYSIFGPLICNFFAYISDYLRKHL